MQKVRKGNIYILISLFTFASINFVYTYQEEILTENFLKGL